MEQKADPSYDNEPYSTLEAIGTPAHSGLQLAPTAPKDVEDWGGKEVAPYQDTEPRKTTNDKRRRVCGLSLPWIFLIAGVVLLAAIGAAIGGVLATGAASNEPSSSSAAVSTVYISPSSSSATEAATSTLSPSSTSPSSPPSTSPTHAESPFASNKWYHIQASNLSLDQNILSCTISNKGVNVGLVPYFGLGLKDEHYWQFRPAIAPLGANTTLLTPYMKIYTMHNRAAGPAARFSLGPVDEGPNHKVWNPVFEPLDGEKENQYWYFEPGTDFAVIRNLESGHGYPLTGRRDWGSVMMAGERKGEYSWEGPPRGSRRFVVSESGVGVDAGEGWVVE